MGSLPRQEASVPRPWPSGLEAQGGRSSSSRELLLQVVVDLTNPPSQKKSLHVHSREGAVGARLLVLIPST